jgi:hypothetical protein
MHRDRKLLPLCDPFQETCCQVHPLGSSICGMQTVVWIGSTGGSASEDSLGLSMSGGFEVPDLILPCWEYGMALAWEQVHGVGRHDRPQTDPAARNARSGFHWEPIVVAIPWCRVGDHAVVDNSEKSRVGGLLDLLPLSVCEYSWLAEMHGLASPAAGKQVGGGFRVGSLSRSPNRTTVCQQVIR